MFSLLLIRFYGIEMGPDFLWLQRGLIIDIGSLKVTRRQDLMAYGVLGKAAEKVFSLAGNLFDHLDRTRLTRRTSNSLLERDRTYLLLTGQTFFTM